MRGPLFLASRHGCLQTKVGAAFVGDRAVFRGHDLHSELLDASWLELHLYGVTGRRPDARTLTMMNALCVVSAYPDARIWCNRVAGLAGSVRSTANLGLAAALAVDEATVYGRRNELKALTFFLETQARIVQGETLADCVDAHLASGKRLAGYGRPLANRDERIEPIMDVAKRLGFSDGPFVAMAFGIDGLLLERGRALRMNYGGLVAALGAELGFSPHEFYRVLFPSLLLGMSPCFVEAAEQPEGALFPIACSDLRYEGPARRPWPR